MTEDEYRDDLRAKGYADPIKKTWEAGLTNAEHQHPHALYLWISAGEMTLETRGARGAVETVILGPSETIEVPALANHVERAGASGVTFLVARR